MTLQRSKLPGMWHHRNRHGNTPKSSRLPARPGLDLAHGLSAALAAVLAAMPVVPLALAAPLAQAAGTPGVTPEQRATADKVAGAGVALADLAPGAPDHYTVKRGDTLWDIATLYLRSPWRWPELWGMNRQEVANPHLIYPGQTLELIRLAGGRAQLSMGGQASSAGNGANAGAAGGSAGAATEAGPATVRLSPGVRQGAGDGLHALPSIPNRLIEPFLSRPLVLDTADMTASPRIVATPEDRLYLGAGDVAYARGITETSVRDYHIYRPARPLYEPDDTDRRHPIAYEARYLGVAHVTKDGPDIVTLTIRESQEEVGEGDRLMPIRHEDFISYAPRAPQRPVEGRILSVYGGVNSVGTGDVVSLDRGAGDGLEIGTVLGVLRNGREVTDRTAGGERVRLPSENIGLAFVFRVFEHISYALLVKASGPVEVGDRLGVPEDMPQMGAAAR